MNQTRHRQYWTYTPGQQARLWQADLDEGVMGLGMGELGNLRRYTKCQMSSRMKRAFGGRPTYRGIARYAWDFVHEMRTGDVIFVKEGRNRFIGVGVVSGGYRFAPKREYYQQVRNVKWIRSFNRKAPKEFAITALTKTSDDKTVKSLMRIAGVSERDFSNVNKASVSKSRTIREKPLTKRERIELFDSRIDADDATISSIARGGQARYKRALLRAWNGKCVATGIEDPALLRASHIWPFSKCKRSERYDINNGLILAAHIDALFDRGLISFDMDGKIMVSRDVTRRARRTYNLSAINLPRLNEKQQIYLGRHRAYIFRG